MSKKSADIKELTGWDKASLALESKLDRVLLYGKPGTGKTYFGLNYHKNDQPSYRLVCTDEMTEKDLIGWFRPDGKGNIKFEEGAGIRAWRTGGRLVVDEINKVNGEIEARLMSIIDTVQSSYYEQPDTGEIIRPKAGFSVVATMNGEPEDLSPAVLDRLPVRICIDTPHPDAIALLPEYLRKFALEYSSLEVSARRYSLRSWFAFASMYENLSHMRKAVMSNREIMSACLDVCLPNIKNEIMDTLLIVNYEETKQKELADAKA